MLAEVLFTSASKIEKHHSMKLYFLIVTLALLDNGTELAGVCINSLIASCIFAKIVYHIS
jgi:hypothetical protein